MKISYLNVDTSILPKYTQTARNVYYGMKRVSFWLYSVLRKEEIEVHTKPLCSQQTKKRLYHLKCERLLLFFLPTNFIWQTCTLEQNETKDLLL